VHHGSQRFTGPRCGLLAAFAFFALPCAQAARADPLLDEAVGFWGQVLQVETKVPALVVAVVKDGDSTVMGFGDVGDGSRRAPDGRTILRLGSITKAFTGQVLAGLATDGTVRLTDPLAKHLSWAVPIPEREGRAIRLVDLATHAGGLPREVPHEPGPASDPFSTITQDAFVADLKDKRLLFAPGSAILYSNFGFDLLAAALSGAAGKPYPQLLAEQVTGPLGMADTTFDPTDGQKARLMRGHGFEGEPLPHVPTGPVIVGSGGLYSSPDDMVRWMRWHLDRFSPADAEKRLADHAVYLPRDGLRAVLGMDESGRMDGMGLAWVAMMPDKDRPFILQKAGGLQGIFTYVALAPARGTGVFVAINKFDVGAATAMASAANALIADLAQR